MLPKDLACLVDLACASEIALEYHRGKLNITRDSVVRSIGEPFITVASRGHFTYASIRGWRHFLLNDIANLSRLSSITAKYER